MAILLKVNWVDQGEGLEPSQRIRRIGGDSKQMKWQHTQAQAIEAIERGQFIYYVETGDRVLNLQVGRTADGRKYLTVQDDGGDPQLLLNLLSGASPASADSRALAGAAVS